MTPSVHGSACGSSPTPSTITAAYLEHIAAFPRRWAYQEHVNATERASPEIAALLPKSTTRISSGVGLVCEQAREDLDELDALL